MPHKKKKGEEEMKALAEALVDKRMFGNKKIWCHQHSGKPIRFVKLCPCGQNYECPLCGFGVATIPHECKIIKIKG